MKIAVLGSGNGGHAVAYEWARAGHDVYMFDFPQFDKSIKAIAAAGGITSNHVMEGFQKIAYAGSDLSKVVPGADMVFVVCPAYATEAFGKACADYYEEGQTFIIMPGSCMGAVTFKHAMGLDIDDNRVTVAETSTLPYAVRITGPAEIAVFNRLPGGYLFAALPREKTDGLFEEMKKVFDGIEKAESVLQTTLQNANPVIHPSITTLNAALIQRTNGDFFFYNDGVTPAVGNVMKAVDEERIALGKALGLTIEDDPSISIRQGYMVVANYVEGYNTAPGFDGIKAQSNLDYRYYNEDVGYSMILWLSLAEKVGIELPMVKAMVKIVSVIMGRDYIAESPRTLEKIGLGGYTKEDLLKL